MQSKALSALKIRDNFLDYFRFGKTDEVGFYWPTEEEISATPIMKMVGCTKALPKQNFFAKWQDGDALVEHPMWGLEPRETKVAKPMTLLIPVSSFDRFGFVVEKRKGFYDQFLIENGERKLRTIGLATAAAEVDNLVQKTHNVPLDYIITEREIIKCASYS